MSNPLKMFRKHQKTLLIVFGVLLMISFLVVGSIDQLFYRNRSVEAEASVAVLIGRDKLYENDLRNLRASHNLTVRFLDAVMQETQTNKGSPKAQPITRSDSDEDLVRTEVLARRAEEMGIRVTDDAVMTYLEQLSDHTIQPKSRFSQILNDSTNGNLSDQQLFDQLRKELKAQNVLVLAGSGLTALTPAQAYEYHNRLHRRVKAEVLPLKVEDYISQVKAEPTDPEVQALYDEGKLRYPQPESPDPGFKRRKRIAFEYVQFDFETFVNEEMAKITDEQIKKEYEDRIARGDFKVPELPSEDDGAAPKTGTETTPGTKPDDPAGAAPSPEKPADDKAPAPAPPEKTPDAAPEKTESTPAPSDKTDVPPKPQSDSDAPKAEEKPKDKAPAAEKPATDKADQPSPAKDNSDEKKEATPPADQGAARLQSALFVSFNDDVETNNETSDDTDATVAAEEKPADDKASTSDEPTEKSAEQTEPTEKTTAEPAEKPSEKPATEPSGKPAKTPSEKPEPKPAEKPTTEPPSAEPKSGEEKPAKDAKPSDQPKPAEESKPAEQQKPAEPAPKFQPLEKVKDQIRRDLASRPAQERMEEALKQAQREFKTYSTDFKRWQSMNKANPDAEKPDSLDVAALAKRLNLKSGKTPLVDELQVAEYEIGQASVFDQRFFQMIPFAAIAYNDSALLYTPREIGFMQNVDFLYWKTNEEEAYVPELAKIRDEVVRAWKMREALKLAKEDAAKKAETARSSIRSLKETFGGPDGSNVTETNEFTWMTRGATAFGGPGIPTPSRVDGVDAAGPDFMQTVFSLDVNEVGVTVNHPQTEVYVLRIVSRTPTEEILRDDFLRTGISRDVSTIAQLELRRVYYDWYQAVEKEMSVKWQREPAESSRFE